MRRKRKTQRGSALLTSFVTLMLVSVAAVSYVDSATQTIRTSRRMTSDAQATHLCEAGVQEVLRELWRPFKIEQTFDEMEDQCASASVGNPMNPIVGEVDGIGKYAAAVVDFYSPGSDPYARIVKVRAMAWFDEDDDDWLDDGEDSKIIDVTARFELARSKVFDYTYFVNNYGWMTGFDDDDLYVNGDMRANGNFDFNGGAPTINGSVFAANNDKLSPSAAGLVNLYPVKQTDAQYASWQPPTPPKLSGETTAAYNARVAAYKAMVLDRRRQAYDTSYGSPGSSEFEQARDFLFKSDAEWVNGREHGSVLADSTGSRGWQRQTKNSTTSANLLDTRPTKEVVMPDLSNIDYYKTMSQAYSDPKQFYEDGTVNPNFGQDAYVEVWDSTLNGGAGAYKRITTDGVVTGSAILIGTDAKPIKVHGPVTFTEDVVIKGTVEGQGTLYTGRNTHIVGSIKYKNPPGFTGGDLDQNDLVNEKKDFLGIAARGSVMLGNPYSYGNPYPLAYMTPQNPPTKTVGTLGRYDENGNWIPPFDANSLDYTGKKRYLPLFTKSKLDSISEGVNQVDAILYTNFVGGGNVGTNGGGMTLNGTIICKDEAIVTWSLPLIMNYDNRIRERTATKNPLIDLQLPRSPVMLRATWQDRGLMQ